MKLKQVMKLAPGERVAHIRYGVCVVREVMLSHGDLFGVVCEPETETGRNLLRWDAGIEKDAPLLEDSIRRLKPVAAAREHNITLRSGWRVESAGQGWEECYVAPYLFVRREQGESPGVHWEFSYDSNELADGYEDTVEEAMRAAEKCLIRMFKELEASVKLFQQLATEVQHGNLD